jgi:hypothetical protein
MEIFSKERTPNKIWKNKMFVNLDKKLIKDS